MYKAGNQARTIWRAGYQRRSRGNNSTSASKSSITTLLSTYIQWTQHAPAEAVQLNEAYAYYANELCVTSRMAESEVAAVNAHYTLIP